VLVLGLPTQGNDYPLKQDFKFDFKGLVAFYDPPKANIKATFVL
jgi:Ca2+-transporting ATPase